MTLITPDLEDMAVVEWAAPGCRVIGWGPQESCEKDLNPCQPL
jgi:hypothetical protein